MTNRVPLSILDLSPVSEGLGRKQALDDSVRLAQLAEEKGYLRYWMAEHHGSEMFMSSATALLLARAAEHTSTIRLGAGGVMLPNHAPLMVAEYYGTLATIYGDRFDLGLGRAPGTDPVTASALRRGNAELNDFAADVTALSHYLAPNPMEHPGLSGAEVAALGMTARPEMLRSRVRAIPGEGTRVPLWMLGSSLGGAQVAASLGLPYSFASHFAPKFLRNAALTYRANFDENAPTAQVEKPLVMAGVNVLVAPTREEANLLFTSFRKWKLLLSRGSNHPLSKPDSSLVEDVPIEKTDATNMVGTPDEVAERMDRFVAENSIDELIVTTYAWDPELRRRSYALLADAWN
ncbi:MAG: LLM class flavin-dependent oxidoreductase [Actinomycetaceae bacterium]|nr:LLM class flavin-dependent oxidoreductase [Actinomycetaceae bacterium]